MKKSIPLAGLVGAAGWLGTLANASAEPVNVLLTGVFQYESGKTSIFNLSRDTSTWTFDSASGTATMTGGTYIGAITSPNVFGHTMTGVSLGNFVPTLGTWSCQEGTFGNAVGASLCGRYNFGSNKVNQSTYTPTAQGGTVVTGGDDGVLGPPQSLQTSYSNMVTVAPVVAPGESQIYCLSNGTPPNVPDNYYATPCMSHQSGYTFRFQVVPAPAVVPIPPAVWLFGSALGLIGAMRRRSA